MASRRTVLALALVGALLSGPARARVLGAQTPPAVAWWQGAAVAAGIAAASSLDESLEDATQATRSETSNDCAAAFRHIGQPEVFATVPLGLLGAGLLAHSPPLRRAGERVAAALVVAGVSVTALKFVAGRVRPSQASAQYDWRPFSGADGFPSGHSTMAFTLAAALGDEVHNRWAKAGLFVAATGTAWSRLNDNAHWLSDVLAGAALGITSAQVVERRWTLFRLHPPSFLFAPTRAGVAVMVGVPLR